MKKLLIPVCCAFVLALPTASEAAKKCYVNGSQYLRLEFQERCRKDSQKAVNISGRFHVGGSSSPCLGNEVSSPVIGTCYGDSPDNEFQIGLLAINTDDAGETSCVPVMFQLVGTSFKTLSGVFDNAPFGEPYFAYTWTKTKCGNVPPPDRNVGKGKSGPLAGVGQ